MDKESWFTRTRDTIRIYLTEIIICLVFIVLVSGVAYVLKYYHSIQTAQDAFYTYYELDTHEDAYILHDTVPQFDKDGILSHMDIQLIPATPTNLNDYTTYMYTTPYDIIPNELPVAVKTITLTMDEYRPLIQTINTMRRQLVTFKQITQDDKQTWELTHVTDTKNYPLREPFFTKERFSVGGDKRDSLPRADTYEVCRTKRGICDTWVVRSARIHYDVDNPKLEIMGIHGSQYPLHTQATLDSARDYRIQDTDIVTSRIYPMPRNIDLTMLTNKRILIELEEDGILHQTKIEILQDSTTLSQEK